MYIDPGSGGLLFQMLAVMFGLISGIFIFFSSQIKMFFRTLTRKMRGTGGEDIEQEEPTESASES